ncbi:MAG: hypothetical protein ACLP1X_23155 [Polyangiaceae bacterium]
MDSLPPAPTQLAQPAPVATDYAPGDIYPVGQRERELCAEASHTDWLYLGSLVVLDVGAIWLGSSATIKFSTSVPLRFTGPAMIGLTWGATVGGAWLTLPKCSPEWVGATPREGAVRATWPLALALAMLAGATAPIINGIAIGYDLPVTWSTFERQMHVVTAGVAGFAGALVPYLIPPRTWASALELDRIRFGADGRGGAFVGYAVRF